MGKGDRRTKKGKIWRGSFGNKRPRKRLITAPAAIQEKPEKKVKKEPEGKERKETKPKVTRKKAPKKKEKP